MLPLHKEEADRLSILGVFDQRTVAAQRGCMAPLARFGSRGVRGFRSLCGRIRAKAGQEKGIPKI